MNVSRLCGNPKSKILERSYINVYSELNAKERRQLFYNREYKKINPQWDNTMVLMCKLFGQSLGPDLPPGPGPGPRPGPLVLDAGCGNGNYVVDEFRNKISWACGVDVSSAFTGKNICLDEIKYSNLEEIPYQDNEFNIVLSLWVIEHLKRPKEVFSEIFRVLKPGGSFILCTTNRDYLPIAAKRLFKSESLNFFVNERLFGREDKDVFPTFYRANEREKLKDLLDECGFADFDLRLNYDPGYTSFDKFSFFLSNLLAASNFGIFLPHIVGSCVKPRKP